MTTREAVVGGLGYLVAVKNKHSPEASDHKAALVASYVAAFGLIAQSDMRALPPFYEPWVTRSLRKQFNEGDSSYVLLLGEHGSKVCLAPRGSDAVDLAVFGAW